MKSWGKNWYKAQKKTIFIDHSLKQLHGYVLAIFLNDVLIESNNYCHLYIHGKTPKPLKNWIYILGKMDTVTKGSKNSSSTPWIWSYE